MKDELEHLEVLVTMCSFKQNLLMLYIHENTFTVSSDAFRLKWPGLTVTIQTDSLQPMNYFQ